MIAEIDCGDYNEDRLVADRRDDGAVVLTLGAKRAGLRGTPTGPPPPPAATS
jgi:hypothetical protein